MKILVQSKIGFMAILLLSSISAYSNETKYVVKAGHESLKEWQMPDEVPYPKGNKPNEDRVRLGEMLFFDPRLSSDGNMSCGTCHNPGLGWSDGLATAKGIKSKVLGRASPTIINTAFNHLQMWDGRKLSLEDQATGPLDSPDEMHRDVNELVKWIKTIPGYKKAFKKAYPKEGINAETYAKAVASFERTIISKNSAFDRWVAGEEKAMTSQQVRGFKVFLDEDKGNCIACHQAPNFVDDGFHNIDITKTDVGRYKIKPIGVNKYAFKTPTLRDVSYTAPYFHDGSAATLEEVVEHYNSGAKGDSLSPSLKTDLKLTRREKRDLVAFMKALSSPPIKIEMPNLPQ